ncbi:MAG: S8 family serine peptidase [Pirellulaceae bacterium]|nr:S8 family serine peptidase [Pirellulaceae bacterium]
MPPKRNLQPPRREVHVQLCERRLVLSAQMLFDVLGDHAVQMHGNHDPFPAIENSLGSAFVTQSTAAHNLSGWTQMDQQFGLTGKGQTVAVIDSGIAWDHVALGKGFGAGYRVVGGWDFTEDDANPYDDGPSGFHGTHVAGIIGSDDRTRTGVAPDVDLVALRVFSDTGQGNMSWVEKALQWVHTNRNAFENPITTVNLSLGSTWNSSAAPEWGTLEDELKILHDDGIVVTASAGNSFRSTNAPGLSYPAASEYVLPVASVDDDGQLSDFSQRSDRVLAAPGRGILSTVPDHFLGRDGRVNDFATSSGTSMAAPYVAGASVLVRQAMEMAGWNNINADSIAQHLHDTADSVFDSITKASYARLDLQNAIDAIIPDDNVGDSFGSAAQFNLSSGRLDGWINSLQDDDVYRFTPATNGRLQLDANSDWLDSLGWSISANGQSLQTGSLEAKAVALVAGQTYELRVTAGDEIGTFSLGWTFQAEQTGGGESGNGGTSGGGTGGASPTQLGPIDYWQNNVNAGTAYRVQATEDGVFTVLWKNADAQASQLSLTPVGGSALNDSTWEDGALRLDTSARAGQWFDLRLPGSSTDQGELSIANLLSQTGKQLQLDGTANSDTITVNTNQGLSVAIGSIEYRFGTGQIASLEIDSDSGSDKLVILGSSQSENVTLRAGVANFESSQLTIRAAGSELVTFNGGGGADVASLYDTVGDDALSLRPLQAEMSGAGFQFNVTDVNRIFIHATSGGQDIGYIYDSTGDDRLSVRPQFSSITGPGYYNYISGVERLFAYGTAGGTDVAELYDSIGNDRFSTSGDAASLVGPGFSSYTKFFEKVNVYATAGGSDVAALYGSNTLTQWQRGSDFVSFNEDTWDREARGFERVDAFAAGQSLVLPIVGLTVDSSTPLDLAPIHTLDLGSDNLACPAIDSLSQRSPVFEAPLGRAGGDLVFEESDLENESFINDFAQQTESLRLASVDLRETWATERLDLPEEALLKNPALERVLLDEIFRMHEEERFF